MNKPEKRNLLAGIFITALVAIAYQEMVNAVRESVREHGITFGTTALVIIFFVTTIRFLVGNQLHLISERVQSMPGLLWFYDLLIILGQTVAMMFLGGLASLELSLRLQIAFLDILVVVFVLDIFWILSQWALGRLFSKCKRDSVPWGWLYLNIGMVAVLIIPYAIWGKGPMYSNLGLALILAANVLAFMVDVFLLDYFDVM
ncbi:MAG: hypothetical protein DMF24_00835 [Verrucomicrobia bacterium]|nr:MAG: hypothetical protein DMF24_00835 [Verrucomicrobiota bacterium]